MSLTGSRTRRRRGRSPSRVPQPSSSTRSLCNRERRRRRCQAGRRRGSHGDRRFDGRWRTGLLLWLRGRRVHGTCKRGRPSRRPWRRRLGSRLPWLAVRRPGRPIRRHSSVIYGRFDPWCRRRADAPRNRPDCRSTRRSSNTLRLRGSSSAVLHQNLLGPVAPSILNLSSP